MVNLTGRTALVTGASGGIGAAIARRLGAAGAAVAVHYGENEAGARKAVADIVAAGGQAFPVKLELATTEGIDELLGEVRDGLGGGSLDILVNNAGLLGDAFDDVTPEEFDHIFAVNVRAPFFLVRQALPVLSDGARIVNLSSGGTRMVIPQTAYAMSKGAVDVMTRSLAQQLGPRGITVNAVAPGITDTKLNSWLHTDDELTSATVAMTALGRVGEPDDIADVVAFLASNEARWVTGQVIEVSGGIFLGPS